MGVEKNLIRDTSKVRDELGLQKNRGERQAVFDKKNYSKNRK